MRCRVIKNPDGSVTVRIPNINPAQGCPSRKRKGESSESHYQRLVNLTRPTRKWRQSDNYDPKTVEFVDTDTDLLPDHHGYFKNARRLNAGKMEIDMPAAREVHMDRIRAVRNQELEKADIEMMLAADSANPQEVDRVRAKRQALRDIPQTFDLDAADTPQALAALWPADLPKD